MEITFYIASFVAIISTIMVITRKNAVHALLNFILSLMSVSIIFYSIGAPFVAALEVVVYAGAIMVLFIFTVMMLNIDKTDNEKPDFKFKSWIIPSILCAILLVDFIYILRNSEINTISKSYIHPKEVGYLMFTDYIILVELAGILLMAGIIGAYHIGKQKKTEYHRYLKEEERQ